MKVYDLPDQRGHFGPYGGVFVAETLMHALDELRAAYERYRRDPGFVAEFEHELEHFVGRPSPIYHARRWSELPEIPTLAEAGVPGYEATLWLALAAPAGMPAQLVQRLHAETAKAVQDPEMQRFVDTLKVGDRVDLVYTESLAIAVEPLSQ